MKLEYLFTSESVNEGHPDKLCDQISDSILDACLSQDPESKVACETCAKGNLIIVFGEITTRGIIDYESVVRSKVKEIGYDCEEKGLDYKTMKVMVAIDEQSPEIAASVHWNKKLEDTTAGDQGHMFGYATNETEELMPLSHDLATSLSERLTEVRKSGLLPYLRPDGKTLVTVAYEEEDGELIPKAIHTVVISTQHSNDVENEQLRNDLLKEVVLKVIPDSLITPETIYHLNPSGSFITGGPQSDAGLTGRKIIIDTYGGWGAHGGGAFSGKDPTKVDRSAAYGTRWAAKSLVAEGLCKRCLVQVSYSIGVCEPLSMFVNSYGTVVEGLTDQDLLTVLKRNFDFKPGALIRDLQLRKPIYQQTACHSHFGRLAEVFLWEKTKNLKHEFPHVKRHLLKKKY